METDRTESNLVGKWNKEDSAGVVSVEFKRGLAGPIGVHKLKKGNKFTLRKGNMARDMEAGRHRMLQQSLG